MGDVDAEVAGAVDAVVAQATETVPQDFLSFLASTENSECEKLYTFACDALAFANKVQVYHWSCKSGFHHTHFQAIYEIIRDFADKLVETVMSMGYKFQIDSKNYLMNGELFDLEAAMRKLEAFRDDLSEKKEQYSTKISLENIFADTVEALDKEIGLIKTFA